MPPFRMNIHIMRDSLRFLAVPFAVVIGTGVCFDALGQQGKPVRPAVNSQPAPQGQQPQRNAQGATQVVGQHRIGPEKLMPPAQAAPIDPALESFLKQWELKSSKIKTLSGTHQRMVYNKVFQTEAVSKGKFFLETPDKGRIDLEGVKPKKDEKSERVGPNGAPYRLEEGTGEMWICTGQEIIAVDQSEKTYHIMPLPKDVQGQNIVHSPLPFLFGMKAEEAKARYDITLKGENAEKAYLRIIPKLESDRQNYSEAQVLLEKVNYLPTAVKLIDPSSNLETLYKFDGLKVNERAGILQRIFGEDDPFHPNLKNHKLIITAADGTDPAAPTQNGRPAQPQNARPGQPTATRPTAPTGTQSVPRTATPTRPTGPR